MAMTANPGRTKTEPIPVMKTRRSLETRVLTSFKPGQCVPVLAFPLLREDRLSMSRFRLSFEQMETAELLMNAVNVRAMAYLVPNTAFERFDGIDALNRSYMKEKGTNEAAVVPYFSTVTAGAVGTNPILLAMGKHIKQGTVYNSAYIEAYNTIYNFRVSNRSPDIPKRLINDITLAKAFWNHQAWSHIVPDFDQAVIDGEVPLNVLNGQLPVSGIAMSGTATAAGVNNANQREALNPNSGHVVTHPFSYAVGTPGTTTATQTTLKIRATDAGSGYPAIFAELAENGITVSLSNIEVARRTQAFAALRKQYTGMSDDYIIDLLMNGITVPEQAWRQPILLADRSTIIGMAKRYASDSVDLTASVTNGATFIDLAITTPTCPMGGVVMIVVEVVPEQLFERQQDPYLFITDQAQLPEFLRDTLDPEKVEIVRNDYIDTNHATPAGTFGYAPLNHKWNHVGPGIGGKFFRPAADLPVDEDRMRLWACETANPTLSADFYLCSNIHQKVFVVTNQDPYELVIRGVAQITGNTVFGQLLIEASDDYDTVMGDVPMDRIDKP